MIIYFNLPYDAGNIDICIIIIINDILIKKK